MLRHVAEGLRECRSAVSSEPKSGLPESRAATSASRSVTGCCTDWCRASGDDTAGDVSGGDACVPVA